MCKARNSSFICWGVESKELPVRACCPHGASNGVVTNFEMKIFDGCANPHLGLASIIIAGIDGMRRKLQIPHGLRNTWIYFLFKQSHILMTSIGTMRI